MRCYKLVHWNKVLRDHEKLPQNILPGIRTENISYCSENLTINTIYKLVFTCFSFPGNKFLNTEMWEIWTSINFIIYGQNQETHKINLKWNLLFFPCAITVSNLLEQALLKCKYTTISLHMSVVHKFSKNLGSISIF